MDLEMNTGANKKYIPSKNTIKAIDVKPMFKITGSGNNEKKFEANFFKTPTLHDNNNLKITPKSLKSSNKNGTPNCSMSKSKSTPVISEKSVISVKNKDRAFATPVSHLCSPSLSPKGRRHFIQHNKCSMKRFLSDSSINESLGNPSPTGLGNNSQQVEEETSNFVVGVRVRPFNLRELSDPSIRNVVRMCKNEVQITCDTGAIHSFAYDHCFWSFDTNHLHEAGQKAVFNTMVLPLIDKVFLGYNACLLAYGQTGSGKSYSMMGLDSGTLGELGEDSGVIPRFFQELFKRIDVIKEKGGDCHVEISYFEIYNEKIHDLLGNHSHHSLRKTLKVREHPRFGPYVVDLSAHCVRSFRDVQDWITVGNSQRITAATGMNEKSSRSHSIFSIMVTQTEKEGSTHNIKSKVNLVDLAGSERIAQTCATGDKLKEGVSINKSLLSLGKVITFLSEKSRRKGITSFGPYRESVLTWLLRESLGGNSRTAMLATISPANIHIDETLATLRYACQARSIVNRVYKNEDENERVIRELRSEVEKITILREELERMKKLVEYSETKEKQEEIDRLKKQLVDSEELLAKSQLSWAERLEEAENLKTAELQHLKRCGVAIEFHSDKKTPCLVNLVADPILTGTLLYLLPPGRLIIGRSSEQSEKSNQPDISLSGPLIHPHHCEIENRDGRLFLIPFDGCDSYVNGQVVKNETELKHKDRVVFGGVHYFRVSIPGRSETGPHDVVDFDFAHEEILKVQEERLRRELEESKEKAIAELEAEMESVLGAQKFDYERQIREMLSIVEMQTNALAEERKQKNVIELERNVLQERMKHRDQSRDILLGGQKNTKKISPYKSTFLTDLKKILDERNMESENSLKNHVNLHEMQMMVQEAAHRCKELKLDFEFQQQQIFGEEGLKPAIKVIDKKEGKSTLWEPHKLTTLIHILRENDQKNEVIKMLTDFNLNWETDELETKEKSISINTDYFKKRLSQNLWQQKMDSSITENERIPENVKLCLEEIQKKTENLLQFFSASSPASRWKERVQKAMEYLDMFLSIIQGDESANWTASLGEGNEKLGKCVRFSGIPKTSP